MSWISSLAARGFVAGQAFDRRIEQHFQRRAPGCRTTAWRSGVRQRERGALSVGSLLGGSSEQHVRTSYESIGVKVDYRLNENVGVSAAYEPPTSALAVQRRHCGGTRLRADPAAVGFRYFPDVAVLRRRVLLIVNPRLSTRHAPPGARPVGVRAARSGVRPRAHRATRPCRRDRGRARARLRRGFHARWRRNCDGGHRDARPQRRTDRRASGWNGQPHCPRARHSAPRMPRRSTRSSMATRRRSTSGRSAATGSHLPRAWAWMPRWSRRHRHRSKADSACSRTSGPERAPPCSRSGSLSSPRSTAFDTSASATMVMVANFGAVFRDLITLGPGIRQDDGLLDLCVFSPKGCRDSVRVTWRLLAQGFSHRSVHALHSRPAASESRRIRRDRCRPMEISWE